MRYRDQRIYDTIISMVITADSKQELDNLTESIFAKASIKDATWTLTAILKNNGVQSIDADQTELPTLTFNEENTASGFSGVNYYTMDYNLYEAAKKLSFKPGASTLMDSGSKEAQELEQQFYIYLDQTATYSLFGNTRKKTTKWRKLK